jgi:thioredoxin 1
MTDIAPRRTRSIDRVHTITHRDFDSLVLSGAGPIVVEFMSYGCAHCRALEPALQQVAEAMQSQETFFRVNTAVDQELSNRYGVRGTPTFVMFLDGTALARVEGPHPSVSSVLAVVTQPFASGK